jgi:hypothetical protein
MTYALIFLVVLIALSPLLAMRPTRRQRELANLRQAAASAGLFVKLDKDGADPGQVYYGCRRQRGDAEMEALTLLREGGDWRVTRGHWPQRLEGVLDALPGAVTQLRADSREVGVLWDERGSTEDVDAIARVLRSALGRRW